jgi:hypothetical protein
MRTCVKRVKLTRIARNCQGAAKGSEQHFRLASLPTKDLTGTHELFIVQIV